MVTSISITLTATLNLPTATPILPTDTPKKTSAPPTNTSLSPTKTATPSPSETAAPQLTHTGSGGGVISYCFQPMTGGSLHKIYTINADGSDNRDLIDASIGLIITIISPVLKGWPRSVISINLTGRFMYSIWMVAI